MLASPPVRAAGERRRRPRAALGAALRSAFCALFFGGRLADAPLVWIGGARALLAALVAVLSAPRRLERHRRARLPRLPRSASRSGPASRRSGRSRPTARGSYTNRTLVYAAFALLGVARRRARRRASASPSAAASARAAVVGWALLAKCVPALYSDYGRLARLRAPLDYWNELALVCDARRAARALARRAARRASRSACCSTRSSSRCCSRTRASASRSRASPRPRGSLLEPRPRREPRRVLALGGGAGAASSAIALALPGITSDGAAALGPRARRLDLRARRARRRARLRRGSRARSRAARSRPERRARVERAAGIAALALALAGLAVEHRLRRPHLERVHEPGSSQLANSANRLGSANSSNRWAWWQEAWHAFTRHPVGGTGAGTFQLTDLLLRRRARHDARAAQHAAAVPQRDRDRRLPALPRRRRGGALRRAWRARRRAGRRSRSGSRVAAFFAHSVVDIDWNFVATCGPLLLLAGALVVAPAARASPAAGRSSRSPRSPFALAGVYSLAAPWLAQRAARLGADARAGEARALVRPALGRRAHRLGGARGRRRPSARAAQLYRDAVALEPENAQTWYELGAFYFELQGSGCARTRRSTTRTRTTASGRRDDVRPARPGAHEGVRLHAAERSSVPRIRTIFEPLSCARAQPVDRRDDADAGVVREPARLLHPAGHVQHHRPRVVVARARSPRRRCGSRPCRLAASLDAAPCTPLPFSTSTRTLERGRSGCDGTAATPASVRHRRLRRRASRP